MLKQSQNLMNLAALSEASMSSTPARNAGLEDIVFTAGLERYQNGTARMYPGLSDAAAGCALIPDPFAEFEEQI